MIDQAAIDRFIALHGVTRCPAAFAAASMATIPDADKAVHRARGIDPGGDSWRNMPASKRLSLIMRKALAKRRDTAAKKRPL